jgi:hypothetical protein
MGRRFGGEGGGGKIHGPEHHSGGGVIDTAGVDNAEDLGAIHGDVAPAYWRAEPRERGEAAGTRHVVEAGAGVEMMAATGASADGRGVAVACVLKRVAT